MYGGRLLPVHCGVVSLNFENNSLLQNNVQKFKEVKSAFEVVGFRDGEVNSIYRVISGILHLGDIEFGEVISDDNTDNKSRVTDLAPLHRGVSSLLLIIILGLL